MKLTAQKISLLASGGAIVAPLVAFAQIPSTNYIDFWINAAKGWLSTAITVIMVLMTLYFLWKVFQFISAKDAATQTEKRKEVFNALLGLFIAVSVWGIIRLATTITGVSTGNADNINQVVCPPGLTYDVFNKVCK